MHENYLFQVGEFECIVINDGNSSYATVGMLFSNAPEDILSKNVVKFNLDPEKIICSNNCLVVNTNDHLVLIDTGFGTKGRAFPGMECTGMLLKNLKLLSIQPRDFNIVILTHYHYDHIGGCSDESGNLNFPNAKYYIGKSDFEKGIVENEFLKEKLNSIKGRFEFLTEDTEIIPGIKAISAPGHTPGHIIISIYSKSEEMLYTSDLVAHPLHIEFLNWNMKHEYNFSQTIASRRLNLERASKNKILIHSYHITFPGLGYIMKSGNSFQWQPISNLK